MKAVIYARYSSDNQREESIEGQLRECTAYAEKNGFTVLRHYIDRAFSAKTDNRPEFQNMIKDSNKKLFDVVIVWKLDRFSRNRYDSARYKATLKKNGVKVISATEVISTGAEGIILESVLEGYAEYYSADLSEKVIRGMTENALKCKYNGGHVPTGYIVDNEQHFQIDATTAPFVLEAFQRYDKGENITSIAKRLNSQGIVNKTGGEFSYESVKRMLKNRRYIGEFKFRETIIADGIPPIVPKDLFDNVQIKLHKNYKAAARGKATEEFLFTTKIFCGYCGEYLSGESGKSHTGQILRYYKCASNKKSRKKCPSKTLRKEWLENIILDEISKIIETDSVIEAVASMVMYIQSQENSKIPLLERQLKEVDKSINNLLDAIQMGIFTKSTKTRLDDLEKSKEELEVLIRNESLLNKRLSYQQVVDWLLKFRNIGINNEESKKALIDIFVNSIYVYNEKIIININYCDYSMSVGLSDVQKMKTDIPIHLGVTDSKIVQIGDGFAFVIDYIYPNFNSKKGKQRA